MKNGISPEYLTHLIPQPQAQQYAQGNRADVPVIHCYTQAYASSILTLTIRQWNSQISEIPLHAANLNPYLTQNQRNHICTCWK